MLMAMLLLAAPVASAAAAPAPRAIVPAEIERHYRDYNLVNAFSTRGERTLIASGRPPAQPRLQRIARATHETAMRSDLVRVASWRTDKEGNEAWVMLDVSTLEPATNVLLVGRFDDLAKGDTAPSLDAILAALPRSVSVTHTTEVHHWRRIDGTWRREAATVHFLAS